MYNKPNIRNQALFHYERYNDNTSFKVQLNEQTTKNNRNEINI